MWIRCLPHLIKKGHSVAEKQYKKSLFIFRRDLRLPDNTGLNAALRNSEKVVTVFIFDPKQIGSINNYRTMNGIQFMVESLQDLEKQLKAKKGHLNLMHGSNERVISSIIHSEKIDAIFLNYDYTPFSIKRDKAIEKLCNTKKIGFHGFHDELLIGDPDSILTGSKTPYGVYSAFYKKAIQHIKVPTPERIAAGSFFSGKITGAQTTGIYKKVCPKENDAIKVHGGRNNSLKILHGIKKYKDYAQERNFPALDATTHLSATHKFGTLSIRESYHAIKKGLGARTQLLKELYWRDFFTYVAYHNPYVFGGPYHKKYAKLTWSKSKKNFEAWCEGKTGFPIVDAGMRQLNTTGWMHNRVRMIVASLLVKDLHINWLWGEKYFARQLVDYDPSVNNGNWQWAASTGCDAQPYFRIFNPWLQQKKFDPDCEYIKKWIPELKNSDPKVIHTWYKDSHESIKGYPAPLVDHSIESKLTLKMYKGV